MTTVGRWRVRGGWPFIALRLGRAEFNVPTEAKPLDEVELADDHRPRRCPQAVEQVPGLFDPADEATRFTLEIKKAMNPDVELARSINLGIVDETLVVTHAETIPSPTVERLEAEKVPLIVPG